MARHASANHHLVEAVAWDPAKPAERVNDFILMSRSGSNCYVVTGDSGDVMINCGSDQPAHRDRFERLLGRPLKVAKIVFTQDHVDHIGGWPNFADPGAEIIAQAEFPRLCRERAMLGPFFMPRLSAVIHALLPAAQTIQSAFLRPLSLPETVTLFKDTHAFEVGGRRFELYAAPSGETQDSLMVWLPKEKVVFTGNWMGALYGALPHFYTLRGDRYRSVPFFIEELERLIAWGPELLVTGHDQPIAGAELIRADMNKLLGAIRFIHDETIKGMNAGKDLWTLMREIQLPPQYDMAAGRGPVRWYVRAVYEEYTGWFRQEFTSELYETPSRSIWPELAKMAGGPEALAGRAQERLVAGAPVEALHFLEIALAADPQNRTAREAELAVLERLVDLTEGRTFDEIGWLETKIEEAKAALAGA
jgi:alkyl sulfatase BDS1-like metallo-beta-lactamase superfamily hydrolase